jgi:hypothetical protein
MRDLECLLVGGRKVKRRTRQRIVGLTSTRSDEREEDETWVRKRREKAVANEERARIKLL